MENPNDPISKEGRSFDQNPPAPPSLPGDHPIVEIPTTFNDLIKQLGYPEPKFVMQTEPLLDQERQNFLLLPMQETDQTISLTNEEQKQNQLTPGTPFQLWSFKKKDSLPGFALIKVDKGANQQGQEIRPPKEIPPEFENHITNLGYSKPILLIHRELTESDLGIGSHGAYFFIPLEKFNGLGFLTEEQKKDLGNGSKLDATLILPSLGQSTSTMIRWMWDNWPTEEFLYTYALSGWKFIVDQFNLNIGNRIQLWTFNKAPGNIGFAVVVVDTEKVEELNRARVIPEEINNRIRGFERSSAFAFVMEMTLLSSVKFCLSLPYERVEYQFLTDEEKLLVKKNGEIDAVLIGPSIDQKDDKNFKIKLRFWGTLYFEFWGKDLKDFVREYGIKKGQRVRIWSFRRPSAIADSHLGRAGPSQIGFALVVVDRDMRGTVK